MSLPKKVACALFTPGLLRRSESSYDHPLQHGYALAHHLSASLGLLLGFSCLHKTRHTVCVEAAMVDDVQQTGKLDDTRIHIEWNHEVSYWSKRFNVSPEQLRKAVESVGPLVKDVKRQLGG
jgi:hypothetical protein